MKSFSTCLNFQSRTLNARRATHAERAPRTLRPLRTPPPRAKRTSENFWRFRVKFPVNSSYINFALFLRPFATSNKERPDRVPHTSHSLSTQRMAGHSLLAQPATEGCCPGFGQEPSERTVRKWHFSDGCQKNLSFLTAEKSELSVFRTENFCPKNDPRSRQKRNDGKITVISFLSENHRHFRTEIFCPKNDPRSRQKGFFRQKNFWRQRPSEPPKRFWPSEKCHFRTVLPGSPFRRLLSEPGLQPPVAVWAGRVGDPVAGGCARPQKKRGFCITRVNKKVDS